jgi:hypothetical protein
MIIAALLSGALVLSPIPASSASSIPEVRVDGAEAEYVRKVADDGTIILAGRENRGGQSFRFMVKDGVVRGWVGNRWVKFPLSEATKAHP